MWCPICRADYPSDWRRCPKDEAVLLAGPALGKYRIDGIIGSGGMGTVYRAFNPDTQSAVAIKRLNPGSGDPGAARARFQREAAVVASLQTSHIIRIYDFGSDEQGGLYLVMELLYGHTLRDEIAGSARGMHPARVHLVSAGALRGLGAAHRAGVIHRDLKPENIFVASTDDGEVAKVLDFGIARVDAESTSLTQSGALMGTPGYMAPEQIAGNRGEVGPQSDVYAVGVIIYEMLTGRAAFAAESITATLSRVLGRDYIPLRTLRPDLPRPLIEVVDRAMADDFRDRFVTADALHRAWSEALTSLPIALGPPPGFQHIPTLDERTQRNLDVGSAPTATPNDFGAAPTMTPDDLRRPSEQPSQSAQPSQPSQPAQPSHSSPRLPAPANSLAGSTRADALGHNGPAHATPRAASIVSGRRTILLAAAVVGVIAAAAAIYLAASPHGSGVTDAGVAAIHDAQSTADANSIASVAPIDAAAGPADMARHLAGTTEIGVDAAIARKFPDAMLRRSVTVAPFWIDLHEMTVKGFRAVMPQATGVLAAKANANGDEQPVRSVNWQEANDACRALGKRLPTEAEWEYAATRSALRPEGAQLLASGVDGPAAVGSHPGDCTSYGVCDLLGNVSEWTADEFSSRRGGLRRVVRGASYRVAPGAKWYATVQARAGLAESARDSEVGFRCAHDALPNQAPAP